MRPTRPRESGRWISCTSIRRTTRGSTSHTTIYRRSWRAAGRWKPRRYAGEEGRSQWSHGRRVQKLFSGLLTGSGAKWALVSFNSEGHLRPEALEALLGRASADGKVSHFTQRYRRYRADSDREGRRYHADIAIEHLYLVRLR